MKKLTNIEFEQKIKLAHSNENIKVIEYNGDKKESIVKCLTCGTIYIKKSTCFIDKRKISICKKCFPTQTNIKKYTFILPDNYSYIEPYNGMHNKILIRHDCCGFIWKITPNNLKLGKGCPKCNKKISKGEQKIITYLNNHNINFIYQYKICIDGHNLFVDFYLPNLNLYIEYNGEQHYKPIKHFGGIEKLKQQQFLDSLKVNKLKDKLLVISYLDFNNIESILESSTTIPKGSTLQVIGNGSGKFPNKENDIVSSL